MSAYEVIEYNVGGAVVVHKEHIVIADKNIGDVSRHGEEAEYAEGQGDVLFLHTFHTGYYDVKRREGRHTMRNRGNEVWPRNGGIGVVVKRHSICSEKSAKHTEDEYKIKGRLLKSALAECCEGNRDQLNTAEEEGQGNLPEGGIVNTADNYLRNFK